MVIREPARAPVRAPLIQGVLPRSIYGHDEENRVWRGAIEAARGCMRPKRVIANRRVVGLTQGRQGSPDVVVHRFHPCSSWTERNRAYERMLMSSGWNSYDGIVTDINAGKYGRTYWIKTNSTSFVANNWYDLWPVGGTPTGGTMNGTAFTARQFTDASTGAIPHRGNVSTDWKFFLRHWAYVSANTPVLMMYDRVLAYDACTFNAAANQSLTNTLTAQRYNSGAPGLLMCIEVGTTMGSTAANLTQLRYTNQAGTTLQSVPTAQTMTFIPSATAPSASLGARVVCPSTSGGTVTWGFMLPMAQGDTGASLVNDYTTSAANTGTFTILLMHPLGDLMLPVATTPAEIEHVFQATDLERVYDGACVNVMAFVPTIAAATFEGSNGFAW